MRVEIVNRKGLKIIALVEIPTTPKGTAVVMHGLGGFKEQVHIQTFVEAFKVGGYTTVNFDTTNSIGESDGKFEDATLTNYYQDLEDVIAWVEKQSWFVKPLILSGHSLGGFSVAYYAENHPSEVYAIAPISPFVSGKLSTESHQIYEPEEFKKWEETGWQIKQSSSRPGVIKKLPWSHMMDRMKYDLFTKINNLTMPTLVIVGDKDVSTPARHVQAFYDGITGNKKELHIITGAPHTFKDPGELDQIREIFADWLSKL